MGFAHRTVGVLSSMNYEIFIYLYILDFPISLEKINKMTKLELVIHQ